MRPFALLVLLTACATEQPPMDCVSGKTLCGSRCFDLTLEHDHCGACATACSASEACGAGHCFSCTAPEALCGNTCADVTSNLDHCGACNQSCAGGTCDAGLCTCPTGLSRCAAGGGCVDLQTSPTNCGGCGNLCTAATQVCEAGACLPRCAANETRCGTGCSDFTTDWFNCGSCGHGCGVREACIAGSCQSCEDCDRDGYAPDAGDCCDQWDQCTLPWAVNPGAHELPGNGVDDNCNGLTDTADTADLATCDQSISATPTAMDFARAIGLCRSATEDGGTWGVISAELVLADGSPGASASASSIRPVFGTLPPLEGQRLAVFSSGLASDAVQTGPGPSSGTAVNGSSVDIAACASPACIDDWFQTARPPLKAANKLPEAPGCAGSTMNQNVANDSVMLHLRVRAPTNASSFSVKTRFFTVEYPEFVCTQFNDQVVLLIDTPGGSTVPANPIDKNLMTYTSLGKSWPVGVNLASGTSLFQSCQKQSAAPQCWDSSVYASSCMLGPGDLALTQFDGVDGGCVQGGATKWLTTTGNVRPGEVFELRAAVWDVGDSVLDSLLLLDDFRWSLDAGDPGTEER